ncbi:hypothetical protein E5A73_09990 [Sphingomonas gei]|uniref:Uncharacterized protein n=1 Tax=Sphingomonas gei TaxID=1395960 RepID=A0A4S1XCP7_9SPHN|nr:hypothetical protein [Sphingomonas gei]TGX53190.1 hypothetical protein E5A73_09990 [Sphingomonas gei]
MIRTLDIFIDDTTWPASGAPPFPATFSAGMSGWNVPILPTLLLIGQLTTPQLARGVSLSEFWAWVRYLYAVSADSDLRISVDFANLDTHQKTILSDDFGMGVPIGFLISSLGLTDWSDGRYFMDRMSALVSGPLPVPRKRGPRKAPDFVFMDHAGALHVVECKGGQSGPDARDRQLSHTTTKGEPSGGVVQKRMVLLPAHRQGQRLACGLSLAVSGRPGPSDLKIVDPEFDPEFDLSEVDDTVIGDPVVRSGLAKALRGAGFGATAAAIAAPSGLSARAKPIEESPAVLRASRRRVVDQRIAAARAEMIAPAAVTFTIGDTKLIGREVSMVLPVPLTIEGATYRRAIIRQGVTPDLIGNVLETGLLEGPLASFGLHKAGLGGMALITEGARGELRVGGTFASEIILEKNAGPAESSAQP